MDEIGFVGTGKTGSPMARRLLAAGHPVTACDTNEQALRAVLEAGARDNAFFATLHAIETEAGVEIPRLEA